MGESGSTGVDVAACADDIGGITRLRVKRKIAGKRRMDWDPFLQAARAGASAMEVEAATESYRLAGRGSDANPAGPDADEARDKLHREDKF
jgi:hypothetical protein